jgi:hypothetical protein
VALVLAWAAVRELEKALEVAQEVALEQEAALEMALVVAREAMALELEPHPL